MKVLALFFGIVIIMSGCNHYNILPSIDDDRILIDKKGGIVRDCEGGMLLKKSPFTNRFWEKIIYPKVQLNLSV